MLIEGPSRVMIKLNWKFLRDRDLPFHGQDMDMAVSHFGIIDIILQFMPCNLIINNIFLGWNNSW